MAGYVHIENLDKKIFASCEISWKSLRIMAHQGMKFMACKDEVTLREQTFYLYKFLGFHGGCWSNDSLPLPYKG
jgi:hypothetical protein